MQVLIKRNVHVKKSRNDKIFFFSKRGNQVNIFWEDEKGSRLGEGQSNS